MYRAQCALPLAKLADMEPLSWPKDAERLPVVLSVEEVSRLLKAVEGDTYRMLFRMMFASGLRVREACRLQVGNLDGARGVIRIIGKGGGERQAALHPPLLEALRAYYRTARPVEPWLFTGRVGKPLDPDQARKVFKAAVKDAGLVKQATPHALRHTLCHLAVGAGDGPARHSGVAGPCDDPQHGAVPARGHEPDRGQR